MRRRVARLLLRPFFGEDGAWEVVADLEELARGRGPWAERLYFWMHLTGYPVRAMVAAWTDRDGKGSREMGKGAMGGVGKDLGYAVRSLARSMGFSVTVVLILALNLGATTAIYSVVKGVLLDPLPVEEPDRLMAVWMSAGNRARTRITPGNLRDVEALDVFSSVAGFTLATASLGRSGDPLFLRGGAVTPAYFATLGVEMAMGRAFRPEEGDPDGPPVTILSHHLWQQAFGADPDVIGTTVDLSGELSEVVGVAPPGIFPTSATVAGEIPFTSASQDYFVPLRYSSELWNQRRSHILGAIARIGRGTDPATARAALETLSARLSATEPMNEGESIHINPFTDEVVGDLRFPLFTLLGAMTLVLLIGIVDVGALFVLRAADRRAEVDIRTALGAPWPRIVRLLVMESGLVAMAASGAALLVALWGIDLMRALVPYPIPRLAEVGLDGTALALALVVGLALALALGLAPALRLGRGGTDVPGQRATASVGRRRREGWAVAVQAGLGVVVLVGAMLLTRSFAALRAVDPGFDALETWVVPLEASGGFLDGLVDEVRQVPGVATAALTYDHPLQRSWLDGFAVRGVAPPSDGGGAGAALRPVGEGYFDAVGVTAVEGRIPDRLDLADGARLAVVNEAFVAAFIPDGRALGRVLEVPTAQRFLGVEPDFEIVGVVGNVRFQGPDHPPEPAYYLPISSFPVSASTLLVRPLGSEIPVIEAVRRTIREGYPGVAVQSATPLQTLLDDRLARPRFNMMLLVSFAVMGLLLCGLGVYGLVGRTVVSRLREIGIRMALGASHTTVARSVLSAALRPMAFGALVGILAALALVGFLRSLLYGISPSDPVSFVASSLFMLAVGVLAALVPTLRALAVDPAGSLREE